MPFSTYMQSEIGHAGIEYNRNNSPIYLITA
jgi:hypothetical protein